MEAGGSGFVGDFDFGVWQVVEFFDCFEVGCAHVGGSDYSKGMCFGEFFEFFDDEPKAAPFDEGDEHVDFVRTEDLFFQFVHHGGFEF